MAFTSEDSLFITLMPLPSTVEPVNTAKRAQGSSMFRRFAVSARFSI